MRKKLFCVNLCPEGYKIDPNKRRNISTSKCPSRAKTVGFSQNDKHLCWNKAACQHICHKKCSYNCFRPDDKNCSCHPECLTGCTVPGSARHCLSCRHVFHRGSCVSVCPKRVSYSVGVFRGNSLYFSVCLSCFEKQYVKFLGRRCVLRSECVSHAAGQKYYSFNDECLATCPKGYMINNEMTECVKCDGKCPKGEEMYLIDNCVSTVLHILLLWVTFTTK